MNRRTEGPVNPNDSETDRTNAPAPGDAWTDALRELKSMARRHAAEPAPSSEPDQASSAPRPAPAQPAGEVDEALAALQALARRYSPAPGEPSFRPPGHAGQEPHPEPHLESHLEPHQADLDETAFEPQAAEFDDPAPGARLLQRKRPSWASVALILLSAAVLAVLLVGALSLSRQLFHGTENAPRAPFAPPAPAQDVAAPSTISVVAVAVPTAAGAPDLRSIEKAMADCDLEAGKNPDGLYFLIVPAVSPTKDYTVWAPLSVGDIGISVILLRSKDALDGLRNGSLAVYSGPYKFSIIDANGGTTHSWPPVTGVAKFTKLDAASLAGFRVRFGFADFIGDTPSNFRFPRDKGVCYWVSALLRT